MSCSAMHSFRTPPSLYGGPRVPRSYKVMLEVSHTHLFAQGLLLLVLTHMLFMVPVAGRAKAALVITAFASAVLNEASPWLIRYVHPHFAVMRISMLVVFPAKLLT